MEIQVRYFLYFYILFNYLGVGKSCLSIRASKNEFNNTKATLGFEFFNYNIKYKNKIIHLKIWDTCGQEVYLSLVNNFYRNASLAIIVYAIDE